MQLRAAVRTVNDACSPALRGELFAGYPTNSATVEYRKQASQARERRPRPGGGRWGVAARGPHSLRRRFDTL